MTRLDVLRVLAERTVDYPSRERMIAWDEIAEAFVSDDPAKIMVKRSIIAHLVHARRDGQAARLEGPGTGLWQITQQGREALALEGSES